MKTLRICLAGLAAVMLTACVKDLNTEPIDPTIKQTFDADQVYHKIYAGLGTSGQTGPDGDCDIVADDEGYSVWYRIVWMHNEFPCDGGWWIWNSDAGVPALLTTSWDASNPLIKMLYNRLTFNVSVCNLFLDNTGGNPTGTDAAVSDEKMHTMRAEVRMMRALNYFYLLDMFGNPPFFTTVSMAAPTQHPQGRAGLYAWILDEFKACEQTLPAADELSGHQRYYRLNQDAATLMMARMYLNAEVYTGQADWENALTSAEKIMNKYPLATNYSHLFMGDNDNNDAVDEIIFSIALDGVQTESWGASAFLVSGSRGAGMPYAGTTNNWECWRSSPELLLEFAQASAFSDLPTLRRYPVGNVDSIIARIGDDRALFYNHGELSGPAEYGTGNFTKSWGISKWTGIYSDGTLTGHHNEFVDTDIPLLRAAEAYMIAAEAKYRLGDEAGALTIINDKIRDRANAEPLASLSDRILLDEWHREFYSEGRRRMDMVRFGAFTGRGAKYNSTNVNYHWEGRGNKASNNVSNIEDHFNVFPIPLPDMVSNPNLVQNEGY